MKSDEFKKILKPLIEKTIREVLLQEGVLSRVVSEVAKGLNQPLVEHQELTNKRTEMMIHKNNVETQEAKQEQQRKERIKKLNESVGIGDVFKNVKELPTGDSNSSLTGMHPKDAGIDISGIEQLSRGRWKILAGDK
tara:strand:- start:360 stop:770 length:411 start_codon:yes stop_codon:yes gene_type:complete